MKLPSLFLVTGMNTPLTPSSIASTTSGSSSTIPLIRYWLRWSSRISLSGVVRSPRVKPPVPGR